MQFEMIQLNTTPLTAFDSNPFPIVRASSGVCTFKNNMCVNNNPNQYGWVNLNSNNEILNFSIKKSITKFHLREACFDFNNFQYKPMLIMDARLKLQ